MAKCIDAILISNLLPVSRGGSRPRECSYPETEYRSSPHAFSDNVNGGRPMDALNGRPECLTGSGNTCNFPPSQKPFEYFVCIVPATFELTKTQYIMRPLTRDSRSLIVVKPPSNLVSPQLLGPFSPCQKGMRARM